MLLPFSTLSSSSSKITVQRFIRLFKYCQEWCKWWKEKKSKELQPSHPSKIYAMTSHNNVNRNLVIFAKKLWMAFDWRKRERRIIKKRIGLWLSQSVKTFEVKLIVGKQLSSFQKVNCIHFPHNILLLLPIFVFVVLILTFR